MQTARCCFFALQSWAGSVKYIIAQFDPRGYQPNVSIRLCDNQNTFGLECNRLPIVELSVERGRRFRDDPRMNIVSLAIIDFDAVAAFLESALTRIILAASGLVGFCLVVCVV